MNPELIDQVQADDSEKDFCRKAENKKRQIEQEAIEIDTGLAQGGAQIEILTLMVSDMRAPENRDFMTESVFPIIREVIQDKTPKPDPGLIICKLCELKFQVNQFEHRGGETKNNQALQAA